MREAAIFGNHGGQVNVTDGRYVYMRAPAQPDNQPLYNYTLMPTHMRDPFSVDEFADVELAEPFGFSKAVGCCGRKDTRAASSTNTGRCSLT